METPRNPGKGAGQYAGWYLSCPTIMNYLHLRYIVTIASLGSLTKASQELMVAQPNLSRIIQGMEETLGVSLFTRSSRGVRLTPEGNRFVCKARQILADLDDLETMFSDTTPHQQRFSVSVPGAAYITDAFARFSALMDDRPSEFILRVSNSSETIRNILEGKCHLGIIRYPSGDDTHFRTLLEEKHLIRTLLADFTCPVLVSEESPLADRSSVSLQDLAPFTEVLCDETCLPSSASSAAGDESSGALTGHRILAADYATQMIVLQQNVKAYAFTVPVPPDLLKSRHLVQIPCTDNTEMCRDVLIYLTDYRLSDLDKQFTTELVLSKRKAMPS